MEGDGSDVPSAGQAGEAETDVPQKDDILLLADEKFDFDLSLSSLSANEDDEIFFGPVGHKERCIAASLELNTKIPEEPLLPASQSHFRWSPLPGEKFVEVYKEAHLLALQIESNSKNKAARAARPEDPWSQGVERFIQESKLKMNLFEKENEMKKSPKSLKRETYYLSDSPLLEPLLSGTQPLSGVGLQGSPAQASCTRPQGPPLSSCPLPVEPSPTHLPSQAVTQKKVISKLLPPRASSVRGKGIHLAVEKPMKEKPASPSGMKILNEKESHRDIPPDKPSAAQHVTGVPASGSHLVQGKRSLPVPSKLGLKKALPKPPGGAGRLARQSSSRGSAPGLASGARASPAAGRGRCVVQPLRLFARNHLGSAEGSGRLAVA
uniref:G2 and S-phase expressed 1 n=1 Tax=Rousettus aegyptiacus TaxID=9407 RepID=A0A7J8JFJ0_ROUAE|nr:G2 and S-phase expressed 1 [Rousettus aegyptiacus]